MRMRSKRINPLRLSLLQRRAPCASRAVHSVQVQTTPDKQASHGEPIEARIERIERRQLQPQTLVAYCGKQKISASEIVRTAGPRGRFIFLSFCKMALWDIPNLAAVPSAAVAVRKCQLIPIRPTTVRTDYIR